MEGIAASSSVTKTSGCRSEFGHSSEMKIAMPSAIGVAISSASTEEYSVPQMNGSAPNSPATGSQISVRQNFSPNFWIDGNDSYARIKPMPQTRAINMKPNAPVPIRKPRSLRDFDLGKSGHFQFDHRVG